MAAQVSFAPAVGASTRSAAAALAALRGAKQALWDVDNKAGYLAVLAVRVMKKDLAQNWAGYEYTEDEDYGIGIGKAQTGAQIATVNEAVTAAVDAAKAAWKAVLVADGDRAIYKALEAAGRAVLEAAFITTTFDFIGFGAGTKKAVEDAISSVEAILK
jgi:hypothetical protein